MRSPLLRAAALLALPALLAACQPAAPAADVTAPAAPPPAPAQTAATATPDPDLPVMTVYRSPTCGCCGLWVDYMREDGFQVEVVEMADVSPIKQSRGLPSSLASCHTAVVGDYVVEGHVPAADVRRLLAERPDAVGIAVPGMPIGSPGMEQGDLVQPYDVVLLGRDGQQSVFASHGAP